MSYVIYVLSIVILYHRTMTSQRNSRLSCADLAHCEQTSIAANQKPAIQATHESLLLLLLSNIQARPRSRAQYCSFCFVFT